MCDILLEKFFFLNMVGPNVGQRGERLTTETQQQITVHTPSVKFLLHLGVLKFI